MTRKPYFIGYARVSKGDDQSNAAQRHALDAAGCKRVFDETASGGRWDRPKLLEMIGQLRDGDVVVVWKLDRLSRSLKDMRHIMGRIALAGAGFCSLTEAIDTTTAAGRMMMQMVGSFAEFERAMIRERTSAGLAQARAEGRVGGRRRKLADKQRSQLALTDGKLRALPSLISTAWLKHLENRSGAAPGPNDPMVTYDFTWMWRELGIEKLRK
jgi:DNA invertase Pin-like site-specific DNA recombinase